MAEQTTEQTYFGLSLSQMRERIKKLAIEKGLQGEKLERVTAQALEIIPTLRMDESTQR